MDTIRNIIGVCPQDNILFENLTGEEHLIMFAALRGVPDSELDAAAKEMLNKIGLGNKGNSLVKTYSGGMKRKLSVGIALIGDPKGIILYFVCIDYHYSPHPLLFIFLLFLSFGI